MASSDSLGCCVRTARRDDQRVGGAHAALRGCGILLQAWAGMEEARKGWRASSNGRSLGLLADL